MVAIHGADLAPHGCAEYGGVAVRTHEQHRATASPLRQREEHRRLGFGLDVLVADVTGDTNHVDGLLAPR